MVFYFSAQCHIDIGILELVSDGLSCAALSHSPILGGFIKREDWGGTGRVASFGLPGCGAHTHTHTHFSETLNREKNDWQVNTFCFLVAVCLEVSDGPVHHGFSSVDVAHMTCGESDHFGLGWGRGCGAGDHIRCNLS